MDKSSTEKSMIANWQSKNFSSDGESMMTDRKETRDDTKQTVPSIDRHLVSALLAHQTLVFDTISRSCLNNAIIRSLKEKQVEENIIYN